MASRPVAVVLPLADLSPHLRSDALPNARYLQPPFHRGLGHLEGRDEIVCGDATAVNVAPQAVDLLGQVGAASNLIAKFGLPFLAIALVVVLGLEAIRYWQRTRVLEAGHG